MKIEIVFSSLRSVLQMQGWVLEPRQRGSPGFVRVQSLSDSDGCVLMTTSSFALYTFIFSRPALFYFIFSFHYSSRLPYFIFSSLHDLPVFRFYSITGVIYFRTIPKNFRLQITDRRGGRSGKSFVRLLGVFDGVSMDCLCFAIFIESWGRKKNQCNGHDH